VSDTPAEIPRFPLPVSRFTPPSAGPTDRQTAWYHRLVAIETFVAAALVITVFLVVLLQVLLRYLFAYPSPWSEEVARFCFVWLSMLGAALAVERRAHFRFDLLVIRLAPALRTPMKAFAMVLTATIAIGLVVTGVALVRLAIGQRSPALDLPMPWVYGAVPVAGVLMLIHLTGGLAVRRSAGSLSSGGGQG
jgi:TRAP-type C4-dicarboxylate transport system permease small subunit